MGARMRVCAIIPFLRQHLCRHGYHTQIGALTLSSLPNLECETFWLYNIGLLHGEWPQWSLRMECINLSGWEQPHSQQREMVSTVRDRNWPNCVFMSGISYIFGNHSDACSCEEAGNRRYSSCSMGIAWGIKDAHFLPFHYKLSYTDSNVILSAAFCWCDPCFQLPRWASLMLYIFSVVIKHTPSMVHTGYPCRFVFKAIG